MHLQLWHHAGSKEFPQNVRSALATQFKVDSDATINWSYLEQSGKFAGRPVRTFRIIDPTQIVQQGKRPLKYADLDGGSSKNAILFEGYIEKEGYVILRDRRPKQTVLNP